MEIRRNPMGGPGSGRKCKEFIQPIKKERGFSYGPGSTLINDVDVTHATLNAGKEPVVLYTTNVSTPRTKP
jgi:hypothetical protein